MSDPVQSHFDQLSPAYRRHFEDRPSGTTFAFRTRLELAVELSQGSSGRLLDCACGPGEITAAILQSGRFPHATLVDLSPKMLSAARENISRDVPDVRADFIESDIFSCQPAGTFDLILCLGLIAHTGRLAELLQHLRRLLSPGGRILLQTTLADHPGTMIVRALTARWYERRHGYRISYFTHRDIAAAATSARLRVVEHRRHILGLPLADRFFPRLNYRLERAFRRWSARHGADALYLLAS